MKLKNILFCLSVILLITFIVLLILLSSDAKCACEKAKAVCCLAFNDSSVCSCLFKIPYKLHSNHSSEIFSGYEIKNEIEKGQHTNMLPLF